MYKITNHTKKQAKKYNVIVKPSKIKNKKIDVFDKKGKKLASVGALGCMDYGMYLNKFNKEYADKKRLNYRKRHAQNIKVKNSPGYWAAVLLW